MLSAPNLGPDLHCPCLPYLVHSGHHGLTQHCTYLAGYFLYRLPRAYYLLTLGQARDVSLQGRRAIMCLNFQPLFEGRCSLLVHGAGKGRLTRRGRCRAWGRVSHWLQRDRNRVMVRSMEHPTSGRGPVPPCVILRLLRLGPLPQPVVNPGAPPHSPERRIGRVPVSLPNWGHPQARHPSSVFPVRRGRGGLSAVYAAFPVIGVIGSVHVPSYEDGSPQMSLPILTNQRRCFLHDHPSLRCLRGEVHIQYQCWGPLPHLDLQGQNVPLRAPIHLQHLGGFRRPEPVVNRCQQPPSRPARFTLLFLPAHGFVE